MEPYMFLNDFFTHPHFYLLLIVKLTPCAYNIIKYMKYVTKLTLCAYTKCIKYVTLGMINRSGILLKSRGATSFVRRCKNFQEFISYQSFLHFLVKSPRNKFQFWWKHVFTKEKKIQRYFPMQDCLSVYIKFDKTKRNELHHIIYTVRWTPYIASSLLTNSKLLSTTSKAYFLWGEEPVNLFWCWMKRDTRSCRDSCNGNCLQLFSTTQFFYAHIFMQRFLLFEKNNIEFVLHNKMCVGT